MVQLLSYLFGHWAGGSFLRSIVGSLMSLVVLIMTDSKIGTAQPMSNFWQTYSGFFLKMGT